MVIGGDLLVLHCAKCRVATPWFDNVDGWLGGIKLTPTLVDHAFYLLCSVVVGICNLVGMIVGLGGQNCGC